MEVSWSHHLTWPAIPTELSRTWKIITMYYYYSQFVAIFCFSFIYALKSLIWTNTRTGSGLEQKKQEIIKQPTTQYSYFKTGPFYVKLWLSQLAEWRVTKSKRRAQWGTRWHPFIIFFSMRKIAICRIQCIKLRCVTHVWIKFEYYIFCILHQAISYEFHAWITIEGKISRNVAN